MNNKLPYDDSEITLKEIILKILEWFQIVWSKRTKVILFSLFVGILFALNTKFNKKPIYEASYKLFFQEARGGLTGALRLASSFGVSMGGSSVSSSSSVKEFITSRNNISHALTTQLLNGRLIDRYYEDQMIKDEKFKHHYEMNFESNKRFSDSIITAITVDLNENFLGSAFDDESGVLMFKVISYNETFAFDLAAELVQNTESQFKKWKREKGLDAVNAFQIKVDSLEASIDQSLYVLGQYEDQNNSLVSSVDKMKRLRLSIDLESLKVAYGEYIKGLEMSKAELLNLEPPFKYFDSPTYPLKKRKSSSAKSGILGSIVSGVLFVFFLIGRFELRKTMA